MDDLEDGPCVNLNSKLGGIDKCVIDDDISFNNMADMCTQQLDMSNNHILTNQNEITENILTSVMTKHDSGIYSEKSINLTCSKDISDCEFSGCFDEGDVINCNDAAAVSDIIDRKNLFNEEDNSTGSCEGNVNATKKKTSQNTDLSNEGNNNVNSFSNDGETEPSPANNIDTDQKVLCATDERSMCEGDNKEDILENSNNGDVELGDENFAEFVRKTLKSRKNIRKLHGDDDSEANEEQEDSAQGAKSHRNYRKRKSDLDSEEDALNVETKDGKALQDDDGTPVLLSNSHLNDHLNTHDAEISETSSDSDNGSRKVAHGSSSDSESEESPLEVSKFGPPKHKWRALFDLREREFGYSHETEPGYFRKKVQGSLQMVQRLQLQFKMTHHEGCVNALHFNGTGTLLASGSDDLNIVIWDWVRNRLQIVYDSGHRSNVFQAKFMPFSGDCHVVSCARDGQVRLADLSSTGVCKGTKKLAQHKGAAHKLALEMDSPHVVLSAGEDAVTFEIDVRQDKPNRLVTTKENDKKVALYSIHSNPVNSNEFCVGGRDHYIRIYDKRKINETIGDGLLKKFAPHHITTTDNNSMKANVTCACYNYNGTEVLGTYNDEDIYLFNNLHSDSADYVHKYTGHRNNQTVKGVNFYGPQSEFVVSGSDCGHVFLWDKETENIVQYFHGDDGGVINVLEPHPFAPVLATSGLDNDVKIWTPTAENPTKLTGIKKLTKTNTEEREEERTSGGAINDGSMLWFIMHHLRQSRRRRQQEARAARGDGQDELSDSDGDLTTDESSDDDDDDEAHNVMACNPS